MADSGDRRPDSVAARLAEMVCHDGCVTTWRDFAEAEPDFAERVRQLFTSHKHHTMATLRQDGSPRISGTEVDIADDDLVVGMMVGARRALDLRRDGRMALHSHTVDPPGDDPSSWCGDAKISGVATEVPNPESDDGSHRVGIDLTEVVLTRVGTPADHLVIESWHPDTGLSRLERR